MSFSAKLRFSLVYSLPKGATVRDFAYLFGTEIGNACIGAYVNGNKKNPTDVLLDGESVQLIKGKGISINKKWLNEVISANAKALISTCLHQKEHAEMEQKIRNELQKQADKYHFVFTENDLIQVSHHLGYQNVNDLLSDLDTRKISYSRVLQTMHPEIKSSLYQRTLDLFHKWTDKPKIATMKKITK